MLSDPRYRAGGYPYILPDRSYIMENGAHRMIEDSDPNVDFFGRKPVLAVGSNMSPLQLARKFPGPGGGEIPVTRVLLDGFDSVYSTHFTGYGAIPATLFPSPGTTVILFITWLNPEQEARMHETEIASENYGFFRLDGLAMEIEHGPPCVYNTGLDYLFVYISSRGAALIDGDPVPLAEVPAENRRWRALGQGDIQAYARDLMAPELSIDEFIGQNIEDPAIRRERTDALHRTATPFAYDKIVRIE